MKNTMRMMSKTTLTKPAPGIVLLHVPANIGEPEACEQFESLMSQALAARPRAIVVDLSEADSVCTVVLGLLLNLRRSAASTGGQVRLAGVQPMVRRVLDICRLDKLFGVFSSVEAAMAIDQVSAVI